MSENEVPVTGRHIAAGRKLLHWSQMELAEKSRVSVPTIKKMEGAGGPVPGLRNNVAAVLSALKEGGIDFFQDEEGAINIRIRPPGGGAVSGRL